MIGRVASRANEAEKRSNFYFGWVALRTLHHTCLPVERSIGRDAFQLIFDQLVPFDPVCSDEESDRPSTSGNINRDDRDAVAESSRRRD